MEPDDTTTPADISQTAGEARPTTAVLSAPSAKTGPALDAPMNGASRSADSSVLRQGSLLEETPLDDQESTPRSPRRRRRSWTRPTGFLLLGIGLIAAVILGIRTELSKTRIQDASLASPSANIRQQQVPLASISRQLGAAAAASPNGTVTVNGQLQVSNSLVLQPSALSGPAVTGQLSYDRTTNTLAYYNGTGFVYLQGGGNTTNNITNNTFITNASGGGVSINGPPGTLAMFAGGGSTLGNSSISQHGNTVTAVAVLHVQAGTNSTTAFEVQNANGHSLLTADTANSAIVIGNDGTPSDVTLRGGAAAGDNLTGGNITIQAANGTGNATSGDIVFETGVSAENGIEFDTTAVLPRGGNTEMSENVTVGTQGNRILIASLNCIASSVTYDGRPLTLLGSDDSPGVVSSGAHIEMWYLVAPPSGTFTLTANGSFTNCNDLGGGTLGAVSYYNVNQTTPLGPVATAAGTVAGSTGVTSLAVTTTSNSQVVVDALATDLGNPITGIQACTSSNAGQTLRWNNDFFKDVCGSDQAGTGAAVNVTYNLTTADWTDVGVALNPATPQSVPLFIANATTPDAVYNRLDITASGNIGVDNADPQYALDVNGIINSSTAVYTPALDTASAGPLNVGQYDATSIQVGNAIGNIPIDLQGTTVVKPTSGNDSATEFQVQNASSTPLLVADTSNMIMTIEGTAASFATLSLNNAHVESAQINPPTVGSPTNCGAGATAVMTAGSTDSAGSFTITAGSGSPSTCDTTVTFNQSYGSAPKSITLTPARISGGSVLPAAVSNPTASSFTLEISPTNADAGATYAYYYWVVK